VPGYAHPVVYSVARNMYGPDEAKRRLAELYGFADASAGSPEPPTSRDGWKVKVGRRASAIVAASLALLPWS
jgi:hypothetical protein